MDRARPTQSGAWWRYSQYEIREGTILPAPGAELDKYDPWSEFEESRARAGESASPPPYQSLAALIQSTRLDARGELLPDSAEGVLDWCARHGLLGIVPQYYETLPAGGLGRPPTPDKNGLSFVYATGEWEGMDLGGMAIRRCDDSLEQYSERALVEAYFPSLADEPVPWVPWPLTRAFWAAYGEPVSHFLVEGQRLVEAIRSASEGPKLWTVEDEWDGKGVAPFWWGKDVLNGLTLSVGPVLGVEVDEDTLSPRLVQSWRYRSLLATLAMMVLQDLTEGRRVYTCAKCGTVFLSRSPKAAYCGRRCRMAAERKRNRDRKKLKESSGS